MTKKEDPFEGAQIDSNNDPLHFEEAGSLFDDEEIIVTEKKVNKSKSEPIQQEVIEQKEESFNQSSELSEDEGLDDGIFTIGAFLRKTREDKNTSLKIISQYTKISVTNLELLESDQLEKLPNRAYVIGYVKSYAKALGLNKEDCLELLDATYGIDGQPSSQIAIPFEESKQEPSQKHNGNVVKISIVICVISILAFALIFNSINDGAKSEKEVVSEANVPAPVINEAVIPQTLDETTPLNEDSNQDISAQEGSKSETPEALATPIAKQQLEEIKETPVVEEVKEAAKPIEVRKEEKTAEEKEENKINFRAMSEDLYNVDTEFSEELTNELLPLRYRPAIQEGQHNIFINAYKGDSWLTYKSDDGPIKKFVLKKGRTILIRGKLIQIFLGNLGAVKIFRNNKPLKISSSSGVKSLIFPESMSSKFLIPLFIYNKDGSVQTSEEYLAKRKVD